MAVEKIISCGSDPEQVAGSLPINQNVPLRQAVGIGSGSHPATTQGQKDIWICPVQKAHFSIDWVSQDFSDWVVTWAVV